MSKNPNPLHNTSKYTELQTKSSNIYAGNNAIFDAGEDINIKGSNVYVKNEFDIYAKNLNIEAAKETSNSKTTDKNMDLSVGLYGTNAGKVDASISQAKQTSQKINNKNSNIQAGNLNLNVSNDVKIEGANIKAKDVLANIGNNLTLASLQNTSNSKGSSQSLSVGTSGSLGVGVGKNESQRDWVDNQTTFIGTNSMKVNVGGTTTIKGAVLANADYVNGKLVDNNNLKLNTTNLITQNIYDKNDSNSYNLSLGVSKTQKETQGKMELGLSDSSKEQINYATIGQGEITTNSDITNVNRDVTNSQVVTKDEKSNLDIYLSNTSIDKALNPNQTVAKWTQDFKDMGLNVRNEIISNLPDSKSGGFAGVVGTLLDKTGSVTLGLIPTVENQGGYITQIATQLSGDNRNVIGTFDETKLIALGLDKNKGDYSLQEINGKEVYVTNPNKTIRLTKDGATDGNLDNMKIYIDEEKATQMGLNNMFTNGIMNTSLEAMTNKIEQQGNPNIGLLNYNPSHGLVGDAIQMTQEKIAITTNQDWLATGSARQTGDVKTQLTELNNGNLNTAAHSQGTMQDYLGTRLNEETISEIIKNNPNAKYITQYSGSPVSASASSALFTNINGGINAINENYKNDLGVINIFKSSVNPADPVAILGGNTSGINNKEDFFSNLGYAMYRGTYSLFSGKDGNGLISGLNDPTTNSPHSGYVCVIGCGNDGTTPSKKYYFNSSTNSILSLDSFYRSIYTEPSYSNVYIPQEGDKK